VGYAPRRTPEIVVSVLVQAGGHGSEVAGPVVRDIIKAYYDQKAKRTQGQYTADNKRHELGIVAGNTAAIQPRPVIKPEDAPVAAAAPATIAAHPR